MHAAGVVARCAAEIATTPTRALYDGWARGQAAGPIRSGAVIRRTGSWAEALRAAGLDPGDTLSRKPAAVTSTRSPEHAREITDALRLFASSRRKKDQRTVQLEDLSAARYARWRTAQEPSAPTVDAIRMAFRPWSAALHAAGLSDDPTGPTNTLTYSHDEIVAALRAAHRACGLPRVFTKTAYELWQMGSPEAPALEAVSRRFGTWTSALLTAGVDERRTEQVTLEELETFLKSAPRGTANPESYLRWTAHRPGSPSVRSLIAQHGSWEAAVHKASPAAPDTKNPRGARWENEDMTDALRTWHSELSADEIPLLENYRAWRDSRPEAWPSDQAVSDRFGSWAAALNGAGIAGVPRTSTTQYSQGQGAIDAALAAFGAATPVERRSKYRYGTWRASESPQAPSSRTLTLRYGSWGAVRTAIAARLENLAGEAK